MTLHPEVIDEIEKYFSGQLRTDISTRILYSTDASIYQIEPLGVFFPKTTDDLVGIVEIGSKYRTPLLARGSGSSLAGQAIGSALIVDCSRFLNRILDINPEEQSATIEPGVILTKLNNKAAEFELQFGPDPASAERATMGGCIANNGTGAHSIVYGMTADHLISADVVLADGSLATFNEISLGRASQIAEQDQRLSRIYQAAILIRDRYREVIQRNWPQTWRCASGYAINYLIPWSSSKPPFWDTDWQGKDSIKWMAYPPIGEDHISLAPLLAGSEGTLAVIQRAKVRLVPKPPCTCVGILAFPGIPEACDAAPEILIRFNKYLTAIELIPQSLVQLARSIPAYYHQLSFLEPLITKQGKSYALLVVEVTGDNPEQLKGLIKGLGDDVVIASSISEQKRVWDVRKVGLGLMLSRPGDIKPISFVEDIAVPVERLGEFIRGIQEILENYNTQADYYAHASAGCIHIRPFLNLKSSQGVTDLRLIANDVVGLMASLRGALSGEHGDGLARSEWLERAFGNDITQAFRLLKEAADPQNILNPGKIVSDDLQGTFQPMNTNLRYWTEYKPQPWNPILSYLGSDGYESLHQTNSNLVGFVQAIEQCNGAGVCRKTEGVMCPSFQATQEEMHSTRGRANLLRAMISGRFQSIGEGERAVKEAVDLCLACKGCKSECPSGVDIAKLKYEFIAYYYSKIGHRRPLRDYLFGYIGNLGRVCSSFSVIVNYMLAHPVLKLVGERSLGLSRDRAIPQLARRSLRSVSKDLITICPNSSETVLFLSDAFTEYFHPQVGLAAIKSLQACGSRVIPLSTIGAGRTLISKGFLKEGKRHASRLLAEIDRIDPLGQMPVIGIEPSEVYTIRDEYLNYYADRESEMERVRSLAGRSFMIDEYLVRPGLNKSPRISSLVSNPGKERSEVLVHGHCYQKAQIPLPDGYPTGVGATMAMLEAVGYKVRLINAGCCGMAGAFGYEVDHYELSMKIGEMSLFPIVRGADEKVIVAAAGTSCQSQIEDGTGRKVVHPICLLM